MLVYFVYLCFELFVGILVCLVLNFVVCLFFKVCFGKFACGCVLCVWLSATNEFVVFACFVLFVDGCGAGILCFVCLLICVL